MFHYSVDFKTINFREKPELYRIGKGEQGVLLVEPYKSEILPYWRFRTPDIARESSEKIYQLFLEYRKQKDFVGMDMARKFLQMGYTRARRYANHKSGRKYNTDPQKQKKGEAQQLVREHIRPQEEDWAVNEKAQSAKIFYEKYVMKSALQDGMVLPGTQTMSSWVEMSSDGTKGESRKRCACAG